ncbi:MAG TPA: TROVE domain-containing protein [Thermoleophilaceae bacterium]
MSSYLRQFLRRKTPQSEPLRGDQSPNSAGGYAWEVDGWARLRRFLILGSEGGSFYAQEWRLTRENARGVEHCIHEDGPRAVAEIVAVSEAGRAAKNDAAVFALAMAAGLGDDETRRAALDALPRVARTGTHLFQFVGFVESFRGWGRGLRRGVARWYADRDVDELALQAVKYRQREGVTHRDVLRLAHPGASVSSGNPELAVGAEHERLFEWIVRGTAGEGQPRIVEGFVQAQNAPDPRATASLVREYRLPREAVKPEHLGDAGVWEALLEDMPMTATIRNLATLTRVGVVAPGSAGTAAVLERMADSDRLRKARVHPMTILFALRTYASGQSVRGSAAWDPVPAVIDALDAAFYEAFGNVEPTGKRCLLALDVSGSMTMDDVAGNPGLTPRDASAAMALVTAATEPAHEVVGFYTGVRASWESRTSARARGWPSGLSPLAISPGQRLDDAVRAVSDLPFGGTDCALPMLYATEREREVDTFVIYTDSETWAGEVHPAAALRDYRRASGIDARLIVVGMVSNGFSIADPEDAGMLDVVGFDTSTPEVIAGFASGSI